MKKTEKIAEALKKIKRGEREFGSGKTKIVQSLMELSKDSARQIKEGLRDAKEGRLIRP